MMGWLKKLSDWLTRDPMAEDAEKACAPAGDGDFAVVILDDNLHSFEYVIEMLVDLCDMTQFCAYGLAHRITNTGRAAVYRGSERQCERIRGYIEGYGPDVRVPGSNGSLRVVVEEWQAGDANPSGKPAGK